MDFYYIFLCFHGPRGSFSVGCGQDDERLDLARNEVEVLRRANHEVWEKQGSHFVSILSRKCLELKGRHVGREFIVQYFSHKVQGLCEGVSCKACQQSELSYKFWWQVCCTPGKEVSGQDGGNARTEVGVCFREGFVKNCRCVVGLFFEVQLLMEWCAGGSLLPRILKDETVAIA